jgi:hypothetical protein
MYVWVKILSNGSLIYDEASIFDYFYSRRILINRVIITFIHTSKIRKNEYSLLKSICRIIFLTSNWQVNQHFCRFCRSLIFYITFPITELAIRSVVR